MSPKTKKILVLLWFLIVLFLPSSALAAGNTDLAIYEKNVFLDTANLVEGQTVRIYASVTNAGTLDASGTVKFIHKESTSQIGGDQPISVIAGKTDDVFVDWTLKAGTQTIIVYIDPWDKEGDNPDNNSTLKTVFIDHDTDRDGIGNQKDPDDDGDGVPDSNDSFPLNGKEWQDSDLDGKGDNSDDDDDNDGIKDSEDAFPTDPNENTDTDSDGLGDNQDDDDDNDGLSDQQETLNNTDPKEADTDGDLKNDREDKFPLDKNEWKDFDADGLGDNQDPDDDNDGLADNLDPNDQNQGPKIALEKEIKNAGLNKEIIFDASPSSDPDGRIENFQWIFDEKEEKEGAKVTHSFKEPGQHQVSLTVTDDRGESRTKNYQIDIFNLPLYATLSIIILILLLLAFSVIFRYIQKARKSGRLNDSKLTKIIAKINRIIAPILPPLKTPGKKPPTEKPAKSPKKRT